MCKTQNTGKRLVLHVMFYLSYRNGMLTLWFFLINDNCYNFAAVSHFKMSIHTFISCYVPSPTNCRQRRTKMHPDLRVGLWLFQVYLDRVPCGPLETAWGFSYPSYVTSSLNSLCPSIFPKAPERLARWIFNILEL